MEISVIRIGTQPKLQGGSKYTLEATIVTHCWSYYTVLYLYRDTTFDTLQHIWMLVLSSSFIALSLSGAPLIGKKSSFIGWVQFIENDWLEFMVSMQK